mmetsp:Transcript_2758/g.5248  ORF Transcript_2758/g.5248 Transcript_2758/m.5248 type:complete len:88 (-) Transcript_2758:1119-1382(-)
MSANMDCENKRLLKAHCDRICCSLESLHYLDGFTPDLLIMDECEACLSSHISMNTNKDKADINFDILKNLLVNPQFRHKIKRMDAYH